MVKGLNCGWAELLLVILQELRRKAVELLVLENTPLAGVEVYSFQAPMC